ncbi:glycoside hydrolase family 18 [Sphingobacterium bovistauri]|uniref:Endoglycosidase n=1 Tax=Sphingobacterium bovistauri TaxID=2781959 RepID=A0ABS7Z6M7_9SPHI|nr:glycoside hydrolase family 18 [Sphingobacterium bovistauri]MCA5005066.1 endoglycosidase [Sphingobacterium bovistauri]
MKRFKFLIVGLSILLGASCKEWTEIESVNKAIDFDATNKTEEYYEALREWKKTPNLPQIFVWFDNWNGVSPTGENSLRGLPDSVTIASNWGGHPKFDLSLERKADMEYVQKVKGTKVVVTLFSENVGDDMPEDPIYNVGNSSDEAVVRPAIRKYAEAIYDAVIESGYDGFDWDYEPFFGGVWDAYLWKNVVQRRIFVEELGYWFGKGSQRTDRDGRKPAKPGLLYLIDGEIGVGNRMGKDWESQYVDYYVLQAYGSTTDVNRTSRVTGVVEDMSDHIAAGRITVEEVVRRTILTENFESYANSGGGFLGMSQFIYKANGVDQQIGGAGLYRSGFDYLPKGKGDYDGSPEYYFLRMGITNLYRIFNQRNTGLSN